MNVIGLILTVLGFAFTFWQLQRTKSAAIAAKSEAQRIEISLKRYDAAQEVSKARYALRTTKHHLDNKAWAAVSESYDDVRRSLLAVKHSIELDVPYSMRVDVAASQIRKLCERIDQGRLDSASDDVIGKLKTSMRDHEEIIIEIGAKIQKGIF